ncbi:ectomycorrhizas secreted protein [Pisolithus albus]|nr:ectomycorrhizas secreted protein [Pisolithus albus]
MPYLRNCLSSQTTRALLCLGHWSKLGLIKDEDFCKVISEQPELPGDDSAELDLEDG